MSSSRKPSRQPRYRVNTLGIASGGLDKILDILDRGAAVSGSVRRSFVRWPFRKEAIEVTLEPPGGDRATLLLACRNISSGGMSVLHNSFVHAGTRCLISLPTLSGAVSVKTGVVVRCSHRTGMLHEVAIRFTDEIDIREFVPVGLHLDAVAVERVDLSRLRGVLVHLSASPPDRAALRELLRPSAMTVRSVGTEREFLDQLRLGCDLAVIDLPRSELRGLGDALLTPTGPLVLAVASHAPEARLIQITCPGVSGVLLRPLTRVGVSRMVADMMQLRAVRTTRLGENAIATHQFSLLMQQLLTAAARGESEQCKQLCRTASRFAGDMGDSELESLAGRTCSAIDRMGVTTPRRYILLVRPLAQRLSRFTGHAA